MSAVQPAPAPTVEQKGSCLPVLCGRRSRPAGEPQAEPRAPKAPEPEEKEVPASGADGASWLPSFAAGKKDASDSEAKAEPGTEKTAESESADAAGGVAGNFLGAGVKQILGAFDASTLGVKVELGALHLDPLFGKVEIGGLTIDNPEGYHSEYALKAERLCIEIDLKKLVWSCGKDIDLKEASLQGVDVIFEKALFTSNLSQIVKNLQGEQGEKKQAPAEPAAPASDSTKTEAPTVTLHRVAVENVGAKLTSKLTRGKGMRLEVGNIIYEDFATECGAGRAAADVIRVLLMTIVKSILTTILGKNSTKKLDRSSSALSSEAPGACEEKDSKVPEDASKKPGPSSIFSLCKGPQASTDVETSASPQAAAAGA